MKKVLLLAFYFVPRNHVASYRSGCFAKYLPENAWQPTVLCEDWTPDRPDYDPDFIGVLPKSVRVTAVPHPKPNGFYQRVIIRKLYPYLWPHRVPILYWHNARQAMQRLLAETRFDAVWATSDPMVPLTLAAEAARVARIPWVADIRDSFNAQIFGSWYKRPFFARQERRLCRQADKVVTVSQGLADVLERAIGRPVPVITNGFDPALFEEDVPTEKALFRIAYTGALAWPQRDPSPLLKALELCFARRTIQPHQIEIAFYGARLDLFNKFCPGVLGRLPVKVLPRITHHEAIRVQKASAVLLLLAHAHEKGVLTGKIFDYLGAGRPILAVPDDHDAVSSLLRQTGAGVSLSGIEEIARQLETWFAAWQEDRPLITTRNELEIARYSRREQTKALAAILDELSGCLR